MIDYTEHSFKGSTMPGCVPLAKESKHMRVEDFAQDHPEVSQRDLDLFVRLYNLTSQGDFVGMTEVSYHALINSLRLNLPDELDIRLHFLRDRARRFAVINQCPDRSRDYTGRDLVDREKEIYRLEKKRMDGTVTKEELDRLRLL
jgi:hypothetical protein